MLKCFNLPLGNFCCNAAPGGGLFKAGKTKCLQWQLENGIILSRLAQEDLAQAV